jgi:hypothetical protein
MRFPRWIFTAAGVYGFITLLPLYFLEARVTPALNHPEHYYGFIGAALAFQVLFLIVARDPQRLRPAMPACILEKLTWSVALAWLWSQGRIEAPLPLFGAIDLIWAVLFVAAYLKTPKT